MGWELSVIKARHLCIIDLHLSGLANTKIAEEMDCTEQSVGMILRSPIVQEEISRRRANVTRTVDEAYVDDVKKARDILSKASPRAAAKFSEQIDHEDPRVAANACKSVLEATFGGSDTKQKLVVQISADRVQLLQQTLQEVA